jgi:hypothetical protein
MAFKETKGNKTVEACVMPAPGGMFGCGANSVGGQEIAHVSETLTS